MDWSIERSSGPSINRLLNLVHCFGHACILQHYCWVVFGFLTLYLSHPRIPTSSHCVLSSSFEMIQNFIELQMAATFISGQESLTKKETPSFRSECLKLWDVKCPSLLPPAFMSQPTPKRVGLKVLEPLGCTGQGQVALTMFYHPPDFGTWVGGNKINHNESIPRMKIWKSYTDPFTLKSYYLESIRIFFCQVLFHGVPSKKPKIAGWKHFNINRKHMEIYIPAYISPSSYV